MLGELLVQFEALAGVAALIAALVNVLKYFDVVSDGNAGNVSLALNAAVFGVFVIGGVIGFDLAGFDGLAASIATVLAALLSLLGQFVVSGASHQVLKRAGVPLFGHSNS
jgi:hypothetical protein